MGKIMTYSNWLQEKNLSSFQGAGETVHMVKELCGDADRRSILMPMCRNEHWGNF